MGDRIFRTMISKPQAIVSFVVAVAIWSIGLFWEQDWKITLLLGLQPLIMGILVQILYTLLSGEEILKQASDINKLFRDSPKMTPLMDRILRGCSDQTIDALPTPTLRQRVEKHIHEFVDDLDGVRNGSIRLKSPTYFADDLLLMAECRKTVYATSDTPAEVWTSMSGRQYWATNLAIIQNGAKCIRIFLLSRHQLQSTDEMARLVEIMKEQAALGVQIFVAEEESLDSRLARDLAIFDETILSETELTTSGKTSGIRVSWGQTAIKRAIEDFECLKRASFSLDEYLAYHQSREQRRRASRAPRRFTATPSVHDPESGADLAAMAPPAYVVVPPISDAENGRVPPLD